MGGGQETQTWCQHRRRVTAMYDFLEGSWRKQREIAYRQYHTSLKLMHAGLQKFKDVMGALEGARKDKKLTAKNSRAAGVMPDIELLQTKLQDLAVWATASAA